MDALGRILKQTDALNRVTTITRDVNGNPPRITRPNGAVTSMAHCCVGLHRQALPMNEQRLSNQAEPPHDGLAAGARRSIFARTRRYI